MAWTVLQDADLDEGSNVINRTLKAYRDNIPAIRDGLSGAPKVSSTAIRFATASTSGNVAASPDSAKRDDITLNAWAMFPMIWTERDSCHWTGHVTDAADPDSPRFALKIFEAGQNSDYNIEYRYFTTLAPVKSWTGILDTDIDQDSPGKTQLFTKLRDNQIAFAEGAPLAPDVPRAVLKTNTFSTSGSTPDVQFGRSSMTLNAGAFFPMIHAQTPCFISGHATDGLSPDLPRFGISNQGSVTKTWDVDYRIFDLETAPAAFNAIADAAIAVDKNFDTILAVRYRDNLQAIVDGGAGAPRIDRLQLTTAVASTSGGFSIGNFSVIMNPWSFFPMIHSTRSTDDLEDDFMRCHTTDGADPDSPRFFMVLGTTALSFDVDQRYIADSALLDLPGGIGDTASTPDTAGNSVTGDIDIRVRLFLDDWGFTTPAQMFIAKWDETTQQSYRFGINDDGNLHFFLSDTGASAQNRNSNAPTGFTNGTTHWVRVTADLTALEVKFYTSEDGVVWTQLGVTMSITLASINDSTAPIEIGGYDLGTKGPCFGGIHRAFVLDGIDGTLVVDFNPGGHIGETSWTGAIESETWTVNGSATVIQG